MADNQYVAFGPGSAMADMDPVVCFVSSGLQNCEDYTNAAVKDSSNSVTFDSGASSYSNGGTAIWTLTRSITASDAEDKALDSETFTFVYAYGSYSSGLTDHGANKGTTSITLPSECTTADASSSLNSLMQSTFLSLSMLGAL